MKKPILNVSFIALFFLLISFVPAQAEECHPPQVKASPAFKLIQDLVGTWKGSTVMNGKKEEVKVTYRLTSGGHAVEEVMSPGTPHEMVSVYFQDRGKLKMTHYCLMGNQPTLKLASHEGNKLDLAFDKATYHSSKKEGVMGGLTVEFLGKNEIRQTWTSIKNGKAMQAAAFNLIRKK